MKTEGEARSFQHLPRDLATVNEWQNHVWSLLLHKSNENTAKMEKIITHFILQPYHSLQLFTCLWHQYLCNNKGIKHDFLCINICCAQRQMLKPEPECEGFNTCRGAQQMLMYQKSMFDHYYCIKTLCRSKTLEKMLWKFFFSCNYNGVERHVTCERFEKAASRAKTKFYPGITKLCWLLCTLLMMTSVFVMARNTYS